MGVKLKGTRRGNGLNRCCDALEEVWVETDSLSHRLIDLRCELSGQALLLIRGFDICEL